MNHVIMANHMISLITNSTTDPWVNKFNTFRNIDTCTNKNL
jgi:hypothetical protein